MHPERRYSRAAFDKAAHEHDNALEELHNEDQSKHDDQKLPYEPTAAEAKYLKAAYRLAELEDEAEFHARRLEAKHKELINAVQTKKGVAKESAKKALFQFEKHELDMH